MTATISLPTTRESLVAAIKADPTNYTIRLALADHIAEATGDYAAALTYAETIQATEEGDEAVTVGRDGADHDAYGNGIYTTKIYRAVLCKCNRMLTWRLDRSNSSHRTAGKKITAPMIERAKARAAELGLPFVAGITQHTVCR